MRKTYDKLVRDRIPEIIHASGCRCGVTILDEEQYEKALRAKLVEEASEVAEASDEELVKEIADLQEVLDALVELHHLSMHEIRTIQEERRCERGAFLRRIKLEWVD